MTTAIWNNGIPFAVDDGIRREPDMDVPGTSVPTYSACQRVFGGCHRGGHGPRLAPLTRRRSNLQGDYL